MRTETYYTVDSTGEFDVERRVLIPEDATERALLAAVIRGSGLLGKQVTVIGGGDIVARTASNGEWELDTGGTTATGTYRVLLEVTESGRAPAHLLDDSEYVAMRLRVTEDQYATYEPRRIIVVWDLEPSRYTCQQPQSNDAPYLPVLSKARV